MLFVTPVGLFAAATSGRGADGLWQAQPQGYRGGDDPQALEGDQHVDRRADDAVVVGGEGEQPARPRLGARRPQATALQTQRVPGASTGHTG